ncbi:MAG: carbohydrate ABC transporter permease [Clostridia bacterium]|nr:carbohydrate ABC transporter permease [Clostridia bacterium]
MEKKVRSDNISKILISVILVSYSFILISLLVWAVLSSLKSEFDFQYNKIGLPKAFSILNYQEAFRLFKLEVKLPSGGVYTAYIENMYLNSILYAGGCAFTATLVPCITSYIVARFKFKPLKIIYYIVIVCMVVPLVGTLPAQLRMAERFGLNEHIWGMWIMTGHFLGLYFLVFYSSFKMIPKDFDEAAKIDGANNFTVMIRIILPLVMNIFFTIYLIHFIQFWNDYQTPLLFIKTKPTISYGLYAYDRSNEKGSSNTPMKLAGCILVFIPVFIVFMIFHKRMMGNLSMGGLKE